MLNNQEGYLEEYRSLREEILRRQEARLLILGFCITSIGTIIGLSLQDYSPRVEGLNYFTFVLICLGLVILITTLLLIIQHTQQIEIIGAYIRNYIEPLFPGLNWQTRWARYRKDRRFNFIIGRFSFGTSRPYAICYFLLAIAIFGISIVLEIYNYWLALVVISILTITSIYYSFDLYRKKSKSWDINWIPDLDFIERPVTEEDLNHLSGWLKTEKHLHQWGLSTLTLPLSCDQFMGNGRTTYAMVDKKGTLIGIGQTHMKADNTIELERVIISPSFRGQGLGQILCNKIVAATKHPTDFKIHISRDNRTARKMADSMGFVVQTKDKKQKIIEMVLKNK